MKSIKEGASRWRRYVIALIILITMLCLMLAPTAVQSRKSEPISQITISSTSTVANTILAEPVPMVEAKPMKTISAKTSPKILEDIFWCESRSDQKRIGLNYRTRKVIDSNGATSSERYVWSRDIGIAQINEYYHLEASKKLCYNIYNEEGNRAYALYLYEREGTQPWNASRACWENIEAYKSKQKSYYQ